ncbi:Redoxin-domain-containing protein [Lobosporangium transversale]|uniref:Thioredoxin-dependent peroxiredoxin n=1 Tax=Lobosporangium transversale TaxID=64571 RepID=A0A1Y2GTP8_9FUNG|nr:Redoxin-domain-containing protein [Lobosporangium transversale]ORZ20110.1 Redoxin-domain-containing protein [Lobosporangium transversale]|eukprot:XP_021882650.1 Redoxin-domain-containing protein [Lobosporangium transversale]
MLRATRVLLSSGTLVHKSLDSTTLLHRSSPADAVNPAELFEPVKKAVLIGIPGAFTPGCSKTHVPGYLKYYDELKNKGVDLIGCVSVNDSYVLNAWSKHLEVGDKITMLADPQGNFVKGLGLDFDASAALGGRRSKRFAMILENGRITKLFVEPNNTGLSVSLAENLIKEL